MPVIRVNGADIFYDDAGTGRETIVFAHGLFFSGRIFHNQVLALKNRYRCITLDFRGHGRSETTQGGYEIDALTLDAVAVIRKLKCYPCHFVGASMGGYVGMHLGLRSPHLLKSLTLMATDAATPGFNERIRITLLQYVARAFGLRPLLPLIMKMLIGERMRENPLRQEELAHLRREVLANDGAGLQRAVNAVKKRRSIVGELGGIGVPTLVMAGQQDKATPLDQTQQLHKAIPGSEFIEIPNAGHTLAVEEPEAVSAALAAFIDGVAYGIEPGQLPLGSNLGHEPV